MIRRLLKLLGSLLAAGHAAPALAVDVPADQAEAMFHVYDGGGVRATGPALLVRKSLSDRVSASASYYVDAVSNASIDVVTTASPFRETRHEVNLGLDWAVRDSLITLAAGQSREPDYDAGSFGLDIAQDVFGGMTTVKLGFTRGSDIVRKSTDGNFNERAHHWQYRLGLTQVLSPRWLASLNLEAVADDGFLASPYRAARVFGATVPERLPGTRSSRALKFSTVHAVDDRSSLRAEARYFWDTWGLKAGTAAVGGARRLEGGWLLDAALRLHRQNSALFYRDNATLETTYITRNRQLSAFQSWGLALRASTELRSWKPEWALKLTGGYEFKRFSFSEFTDLRDGAPYAHNAHVLQIHVSSNF